MVCVSYSDSDSLVSMDYGCQANRVEDKPLAVIHADFIGIIVLDRRAMNYKHLVGAIVILIVGYYAGTKYPGLLSKLGV